MLVKGNGRNGHELRLISLLQKGGRMVVISKSARTERCSIPEPESRTAGAKWTSRQGPLGTKKKRKKQAFAVPSGSEEKDAS